MMGGGKYGITGNVLAPIVKSHAPWVGAWMRAKGSKEKVPDGTINDVSQFKKLIARADNG